MNDMKICFEALKTVVCNLWKCYNKCKSNIKLNSFEEAYRYNNNCNQISFNEFFRTYKIELDTQNRWVILTDLIPWHKFQDDYNNNFKLYNKSEPANSVLVALGSLIIKATLSITDEEVVNQIKENKYLQCFLGITLKEGKVPFDSSLMTYFRKRLNLEIINQINETIFGEEILKERSK